MRVNQETNGQRWVPLGSFELTPGAGHKVVLSDDANEYVVADALRFVHESWEAVQPRSVVADAVRVVANSAEAPSYVHADHLGTPRKMTDQSGALAWDRVAMPFGETVSLAGTGTNPHRFPGQHFDTETGFHYNYFRDYDPSVGRYLQSDPIGLEGGLNTYAYVEGNPINLVDPTGESPAILAPVIACLVNPACASGGAAVVGGAIYCLLAPDLCKVPNLSSTDFCPLPSDFYDHILLSEDQSKRNTPDQEAVIDLAQEAKQKGGLSQEEAEALVDLAEDVGVKPARGPESHPDRPHGKNPHIHIGPIDHIPVK